MRAERKKPESNKKKKIFIVIAPTILAILVSAAVVVAITDGNKAEVKVPSNVDETVNEQKEKDKPESIHQDERKVPPKPPLKKEKISTNDTPKEPKQETGNPSSTTTPNKEPIKVEVEKDTQKYEKPSTTDSNNSPFPTDKVKEMDKKESGQKDTSPKPKPKEGKEPPKDSESKEDEKPAITPEPTPKPENPSKPTPEEPKTPEDPIQFTYLSATKAHRILNESGIFQKVNNEYLLRDDWGVVLNVKVGKEHVGFIYFDGTTYYTAKETAYEEILGLVGDDVEQAELEWQYIQNIILESEMAVRAAADAVYGTGTEKANELYLEILEAGKTADGYFNEF